MKRRRIPTGFQEPEFAVARAAAFPTALLEALTAAAASPAALGGADGPLAEAIERDVAVMAERVCACLERDDVREALFLSSPSLAEAAEQLRRDPARRRHGGTVGRLYRYLSRMTARPTPFALSAGYAVVRPGPSTELRLDGERPIARRTRLDTTFVGALRELAWSRRAVRRAARYGVNALLVQREASVSVVASHRVAATGLAEEALAVVERSAALDALLVAAASPCPFDALVAAVQRAVPDVDEPSAAAFVEEVIEQQVLCPTDRGTALDRDPMQEAAALAEAVGEGTREALAAVEAELASWDAAGEPIAADRYRAVTARLRTEVPDADPRRIYHVDARLRLRAAEIDREVVDEVLRGLPWLARLQRPPPQPGLDRFRAEFRARYGARWIPLPLLFEGEAGIGFERTALCTPLPLTDGFVMPAAARAPQPSLAPAWVRLAERARRAGSPEIVLTDDDLAELVVDEPGELPDAFAVAVTLFHGRGAEGPRAVLHGLRGPSGAWSLGRFCQDDPELRQVVERHLRAEEALRPDVIFAEIDHLPNDRVGNVLYRPRLRRHAIRFPAASTEDGALPLDDLLVGIEGDRVVVHSRRLDRRVLPRLSSALHAANGFELFRFLCALQDQDLHAQLGLSLGPFTPRVRYGRIVWQLASWTLTGRELKAALDASPVGRYRLVQRLRQELALPRWVRVGNGDETVALDLEQPLCVDELVRLLAADASARLFEVLPALDDAALAGGGGAHVHEILIPVVRSAPAVAGAPAVAAPARPVASHRFAPGDRWLAAHVYCAPHVADRLLREWVAPLVSFGREAGALERWFFIRYGDPWHHLRVRFAADPAWLASVLLPRMHAALGPWLGDGAVWRHALETYDREIERYGGPDAIAPVEALFEADSELVLALGDALAGDTDGQLRWRAALMGLHQLAAAFAPALEARVDLLARARGSMLPRGRSTKPLEEDTLRRFRALRDELDSLVAAGWSGEAAPAFGAHRGAARSTAEALAAIEARGGKLDGARIASSLLHMHVNRMIPAEHEAHELLLYDLLHRLYRAEHGRVRAGRGQAPAAVSAHP